MLYALSFMTRGTAEVWAHNQTQAIIDGTSSIPTFEAFIKQVENAFGDPDHTRIARTKLHDLKMSLSMSANEYTAVMIVTPSQLWYSCNSGNVPGPHIILRVKLLTPFTSRLPFLLCSPFISTLLIRNRRLVVLLFCSIVLRSQTYL